MKDSRAKQVLGWSALVLVALLLFAALQRRNVDDHTNTQSEPISPSTVALDTEPTRAHLSRTETALKPSIKSDSTPAASKAICKDLDTQFDSRRAVFSPATLQWLQAKLPGNWRADELYLLMDALDRVVLSQLRNFGKTDAGLEESPYRGVDDKALLAQATQGDDEARFALAHRALTQAWAYKDGKEILGSWQQHRTAVEHLKAAAKNGHATSFHLLLKSLDKVLGFLEKDTPERNLVLAEYGAWREIAGKHGDAALVMEQALMDIERTALNSEISAIKQQFPKDFGYVVMLKEADQEMSGRYPLADDTRRKVQTITRNHQQVFDMIEQACKAAETADK